MTLPARPVSKAIEIGQMWLGTRGNASECRWPRRGILSFRLAAYCSSYTKAPRHNPQRNPYDCVGANGTNDGKSWTAAPMPTGTALYTLEPLVSHAGVSVFERQPVVTFAAQPANRHGCRTPTKL
ncbi:hypothetical protein ABZX95_33875 [Streptomyces sp. NPDC004232]|uniref:hypothetical protein n=1 Tax=Streptomyces sp. NPDC004232 TaxID=3154454 RepID=UPI0033B9367D